VRGGEKKTYRVVRAWFTGANGYTNELGFISIAGLGVGCGKEKERCD
jgi:hypothetical protein